MHSNTNGRCPGWNWNADSDHPCNWIVSSVPIYAFQLYLELSHFSWNVSRVNWKAPSVILNASSVDSSQIP
jgi:hypothetical protein